MRRKQPLTRPGWRIAGSLLVAASLMNVWTEEAVHASATGTFTIGAFWNLITGFPIQISGAYSIGRRYIPLAPLYRLSFRVTWSVYGAAPYLATPDGIPESGQFGFLGAAGVFGEGFAEYGRPAMTGCGSREDDFHRLL